MILFFVVMILNWLVGLFCGVIIVCIIVGVVGVILLVGWKFGVFEFLNFIFVVGFVVDYVVYFVDGYVRF